MISTAIAREQTLIHLEVEYIDTGTPITHTHYIASPKGEIYGADHTMERFAHELSIDMRPKTEVPGLFLTGKSYGSLSELIRQQSMNFRRSRHPDVRHYSGSDQRGCRRVAGFGPKSDERPDGVLGEVAEGDV